MALPAQPERFRLMQGHPAEVCLRVHDLRLRLHVRGHRFNILEAEVLKQNLWQRVVTVTVRAENHSEAMSARSAPQCRPDGEKPLFLIHGVERNAYPSST